MVVRMRSTRSHTGNRRSHHKAVTPRIGKDEDGVHVRHRVNMKTGKYRGKQILKVKENSPALAEKKVAKKTVKKEEKKEDK